MTVRKRPEINSTDAERFIRGAAIEKDQVEETKSSSQENVFPWHDADPRIKKGINLRLDEVQWAKLRFISEQTPYSIQRFIMAALEPAIEREITKLTGRK